VPKHRGITIFLIEVHQPGIEIRPIRQINGKAEFNEAFFTDARVPDANRIGDVDAGWGVALQVLSNERSNAAGGGERVLRIVAGGERKGYLDRRCADILATPDFERGANPLPIGDTASVIALARQHGKLDDPNIRQGIARTHAFAEALRLTRERAHASITSAGTESSVAYLGGVRLIRFYRDLVGAIAGPWATLWDNPVAETITTAPCHGIQGGAEQIQLNVIGERILGLPPEPRLDKDVAFKDIPQNT
jgi:alkylation response protein AidB-like acyl-CoA dehydrogenase